MGECGVASLGVSNRVAGGGGTTAGGGDAVDSLRSSNGEDSGGGATVRSCVVKSLYDTLHLGEKVLVGLLVVG